VSHAGLALLRRLSDVTGLTGGLSGALVSRRLLMHDRGGVLADLACAIADGAQVISDFRATGDQAGLFGPVASVPTLWRIGQAQAVNRRCESLYGGAHSLNGHQLGVGRHDSLSVYAAHLAGSSRTDSARAR